MFQTDDPLNITQIGMESVRVISERLRGLSGQHLVDWTADTYGPLVSYTLIPQTDRVELISDGDGKSANHDMNIYCCEREAQNSFYETIKLCVMCRKKQFFYR